MTRWFERTAILFVVGLIAAALLPLFLTTATSLDWPDAYLWRMLRFTLLQAALSTLLSVIPAILTARALQRKLLLGGDFLRVLFAVPLALPAIVVVLAISSLYGAASLMAPWFNLYGLNGILLAHVFFNLPLATRLLAQAYQSIPDEHLRLGQELRLTGWQHFQIVEFPYLRATVLEASALIFLLCAASFVIVLTLGGGPQATTIEVAIFQSLRLDFDLARALSLGLMQLILGLAMFTILASMARRSRASEIRLEHRLRPLPSLFGVDVAALILATVLVLPPLVSLIWNGITNLRFDATVAKALATSVGIGAAASVLATLLALGLARAKLGAPLANLGLIISPAVIATGWFILSLKAGWREEWSIAAIILLNALMALPFAHASLAPALKTHHENTARLSTELELRGLNKLRLIDVPLLRGVLAAAALMAFVVSLGDLAAILMLGSGDVITLPSLLQQQMGRYQFDAANGTALLLAALCLGLTTLSQRLGSRT